MFDKNLVDALIGGKDLDCGSAELSVNLGLTRGHGSGPNNTSGPSARDKAWPAPRIQSFNSGESGDQTRTKSR